MGHIVCQGLKRMTMGERYQTEFSPADWLTKSGEYKVDDGARALD